MPVEAKDIDKVRQLVRQRDAIKELKKSFSNAARFSVRALNDKGQVMGEVIRLKNENAYVTEALKQFKDNMDAQITALETQISGMGITP